jgi:hypothetical protein
MRKGRADAAEDLGDKDGGVALRFGVVDPLHRCGANLRGQERAALAEQGARAGASDACGALRTDLFVCVDGSMRLMGTGHPNAL